MAMNQQEMISSIAQDLAHIADGPDLDIQNELRILYNSHRRKDLAAGKSRNETIRYCINFLKGDYPGWQPNVDKTYFEIQ